MRRREFIIVLGASVAFRGAAYAQPVNEVRRIGAVMAYAESDPEGQVLLRTFTEALDKLGWKASHNVRIDCRWAGGNIERMRLFAKELVGLHPDVILANTTPVIAAFQKETRTLPIIFVVVSDPIGDGFVTSLAKPGGNMTGFLHLEASVGGKWLELLKEIVPRLGRAAIMFNPDTAPGHGNYYLPSLKAAAQAFAVESIVAPVRSDADIEAALESLANQPASGLVVMSDGFVRVHRQTIIAATARHAIPAVYPLRVNAAEGGLLAYGPHYEDLFRQSASYVDRILKGEKPTDLPVQAPTKYELVINLKTAKALGLTVPPTLLARADEVIE
jgi:putative tryptophan/tyrosine transport system substrate-binding protein